MSGETEKRRAENSASEPIFLSLDHKPSCSLEAQNLLWSRTADLVVQEFLHSIRFFKISLNTKRWETPATESSYCKEQPTLPKDDQRHSIIQLQKGLLLDQELLLSNLGYLQRMKYMTRTQFLSFSQKNASPQRDFQWQTHSQAW